MIPTQYLRVLCKICERLEGSPINWVVTGSLGMALQGVPVPIHDIDIQTDEECTYEIERRFPEYVIKPVHCSASERIRSQFGALEIDGITVEIMGGIQKLLDDGTWEEPVKVECYRRWVEMEGLRIPVLSLEYEYQAYLKLGRSNEAEMLRDWLLKSR